MVLPAAGEARVTVGGVESPGGIKLLETVTDAGAEAVMLPAASRATAVNVYEPFGTVVVSAAIA